MPRSRSTSLVTGRALRLEVEVPVGVHQVDSHRPALLTMASRDSPYLWAIAAA